MTTLKAGDLELGPGCMQLPVPQEARERSTAVTAVLLAGDFVKSPRAVTLRSMALNFSFWTISGGFRLKRTDFDLDYSSSLISRKRA